MNLNPKKPGPAPRRPSSRCFGGLPSNKKSSPRDEAVHFGPFLPKAKPVRFDDFVTDCVAISLANLFVVTNSNRAANDWLAPTIPEQLFVIREAVLRARTFDGELFSEAMARHRRELFVDIVEIEDEITETVTIDGLRGFGLEPTNLACHPMRLATSGFSNGSPVMLKLPVTRWRIARRKFSLPPGRRKDGRHHVPGPYLAVAAYEPKSKAVARIRMWPVWYSPALNRMELVRSNLERAGADAFSASGALAVSAINKSQLGILQAGLAHRWSGDITSYQFLPDYLVMPAQGMSVSVVEIFGIHALKRYDASKSKKKAHGLGNADIRFVPIEGTRLDATGVAAQILSIVSNPAFNILSKKENHRDVA